MTISPMQTLKTAARRLASPTMPRLAPPALLLLALSSVLLFGGDRGNLYRYDAHNSMSAKNLAIADNLSPEHHFLMFLAHTLDADGKHTYEAYNRFPIGSYALIKLAILPFGDNLSAKIYAARMLMLLCFAAAAILAYLALRRITSNCWIALTATLLAFSSIYCLAYSDMISNEAIIDLFAVMLVFHAMTVFEQEGRFRQLIIKACAALLLGWHVYALLLPFIAFGLMREIVKARSSISALCQLKRSTLSLLRSRYLTLGVVALLFGISVLTFNFTNEYFALNRETSLTELPSFKSMMHRTGVEPRLDGNDKYLLWPAFPELQFYRIGTMTLPYAFSPSYVSDVMTTFNYVDYPGSPLRLFVILGIAVFGASLIGLLFVRGHTILLAALALSGFCWALPMRHNTALPNHNHESIFYIGVGLTLFSLALMCLRKLSHEWVVRALSVAALLIFAFSALRMSQSNIVNQPPELHKAIMADFESIRKVTQYGDAIFREDLVPGYRRGHNVFVYYLTGRIRLNSQKNVPSARPPDFIIMSERVDELATLTPNNRILFLYEWNDYHKYISEIIESDEPLIRSDFDVWLNDNNLIYVKDHCREDDINNKFFLAVHPADENDLPNRYIQRGFHNLDFNFERWDIQLDERCIAIRPLPDYDIARIYTGQFIRRADGSYQHIWESEIHLTETAR